MCHEGAKDVQELILTKFIICKRPAESASIVVNFFRITL